MHLANFGNRAWCRLEVYVFSCLVEIMQRPVTCFAYGHHRPVAETEEIPESEMITGRSVRSGFSSLINCFRGSASDSCERLVPLFAHSSGAQFATTYLPSSGDLTVEDDRGVVRDIERVVQTAYSTFAVKNEVDRLAGNLNATASMVLKQAGRQSSRKSLLAKSFSTKSLLKPTAGSSIGGSVMVSSQDKSVIVQSKSQNWSSSTSTCYLDSKQIHDSDIGFLAMRLSQAVRAGQVTTLSLCDNMLTDSGVKDLLRKLITNKESAVGQAIQSVDLGGNPIGIGGAMLFERCLTGSGIGSCKLERIGLSSTNLGSDDIIALAKWLGLATPLREIDLRGSEALSAEAVGALTAAADSHGHLDVEVDDAAMKYVAADVVARFVEVRRKNIAATGASNIA